MGQLVAMADFQGIKEEVTVWWLVVVVWLLGLSESSPRFAHGFVLLWVLSGFSGV